MNTSWGVNRRRHWVVFTDAHVGGHKRYATWSAVAYLLAVTFDEAENRAGFYVSESMRTVKFKCHRPADSVN